MNEKDTNLRLANGGIAYSPVTWAMHWRYWAAWPRALFWELPRVRILGHRYTLDRTIRIICPGCGQSVTAQVPMRYDGASWAPDLRDCKRRHSAAFPVHDHGWGHPQFDSGEVLSFDHINALMCYVMMREGQPRYAIRTYARGVSCDMMRGAWLEKHHPAPPHVHGECKWVMSFAESKWLDGALKLDDDIEAFRMSDSGRKP